MPNYHLMMHGCLKLEVKLFIINLSFRRLRVAIALAEEQGGIFQN